MKILISWLAFNNDFLDGEVYDDGPTYSFHQRFFNHDEHIILSSANSDDTRLQLLVNKLKKIFQTM